MRRPSKGNLPRLSAESQRLINHARAMLQASSRLEERGWEKQLDASLLKSLKKRPIDYFRMFYADTALFGSASGTRCGMDFFGVDKVVFASDAPFDPEGGPMYIRDTIKVIDELDISDADRRKIYNGNACKLLSLTV